MLAKILSQKHGFECKVLFAWDNTGKHIDPNNQKGVRGWHHLKNADLMIIGTRFRQPAPDEAKHVTNFLNQGKPVIGIRTSTHAFTGSGNFGGKIPFGQFGPLIMGEGWVSHHGRHKLEGARGIIEAKNAAHPILNGVTDVFGPSDVYGIRRLTDKDTILMRGAVTATLSPDSDFVDAKNDPMQPLAWLHPYTAPNGKNQNHFLYDHGSICGSSKRRLKENARQCLIFPNWTEGSNPCRCCLCRSILSLFYGFIREKTHWPSLDMQPEDYGLGKSPVAPEPKGSPKWEYRDSPKINGKLFVFQFEL